MKRTVGDRDRHGAEPCAGGRDPRCGQPRECRQRIERFHAPGVGDRHAPLAGRSALARLAKRGSDSELSPEEPRLSNPRQEIEVEARAAEHVAWRRGEQCRVGVGKPPRGCEGTLHHPKVRVVGR